MKLSNHLKADGFQLKEIADGTAPQDAVSVAQLDAAIAGASVTVADLAMTGTPTAPTAAPGTNTTQVATTAFVAAATAGGAGVDTLLFWMST